MQKPDGLVIIRKEDVPGLLKDLPVSKLTGIGKKTEHKLNFLGISTCSDLAGYPLHVLVKFFGKPGVILHKMGKGQDDSPVMPVTMSYPVKSMGHSFTLPREDTRDANLIRAILRRLSEQVARRLRKDNYRGRTVTLVVRFPDFSTFIRQKSLKAYTDDGGIIYHTALLILKSLCPEGTKIRMLGVSVSNLKNSETQQSLFEEENRRSKLIQVTDHINNRYGEFTLIPARLLAEFTIHPAREPC